MIPRRKIHYLCQARIQHTDGRAKAPPLADGRYNTSAGIFFGFRLPIQSSCILPTRPNFALFPTITEFGPYKLVLLQTGRTLD